MPDNYMKEISAHKPAFMFTYYKKNKITSNILVMAYVNGIHTNHYKNRNIMLILF